MITMRTQKMNETMKAFEDIKSNLTNKKNHQRKQNLKKNS